MATDSTDSDRPNLTVTVVVILLAILLWIIVAVEFVFVVPLYERIFRDFQVVLPFAAEVVIATSRWFVKYFYILPVPFVILGIAVAASTWAIRHSLQKRGLGLLWCALMLLLPALVGFLIWFSCYLPYAELLEALAGKGG
jgi:type II secretory pathway component PulF